MNIIVSILKCFCSRFEYEFWHCTNKAEFNLNQPKWSLVLKKTLVERVKLNLDSDRNKVSKLILNEQRF